MMPEQENEPIARWMGWETTEWGKGLCRWSRGLGSVVHYDVYYDGAPNYRTDPALNRELEDRLCEQYGWHFSYDDKGKLWYAHRRREASPCTYASHNEAVFAAAVMQVEQEGK